MFESCCLGYRTSEKKDLKRGPILIEEGDCAMLEYKSEIIFSMTCICLSVFLAIISFNYSLESKSVDYTTKLPVADSSRFN